MNRLILPTILSLLIFGCSSPHEEKPSDTEKTEANQPLVPNSNSSTVGAISETGGVSDEGDTRNVQELLEELLRAKNPGYKGGVQFEMDQGLPVGISLAGLDVEDISMLEDLPLLALDLSGTRVSDISVLKGMPLRMLAMEQTRVEDLSPLKDSQIQQLHLNNTRVRNLQDIEGLPIRELYLPETRVVDLSPLVGMPITGLWLNDTDVEDITVLGTMPLETVTLRGTRVKDLTPLARVAQLKRIHIAETRVEDLTPIAGLQLTRLLFTPSRINKGMDLIRLMPTLKELGDSFDSRMPPAQFWPKYDAGGYR